MSLDKAMQDIKKSFGKNKIGEFENVTTIGGSYSTGSITLDSYIKGGFPRGKITEIFGPESSGKTTLTIHAIADAQAQGDVAAFIDMEGTFDPEYATTLGVDIPSLIYTSPDTGEEALEIAERLIRSGEVGIVVIDSVATLLPGKEAEGEYGGATMGLHARLMSQACRKLNPVIKKNNTAFVFINQLRSKIGGYGNPEVTTGGNSIKFYAAIQLDIRRNGKPIKDKDDLTIGEPRRVTIKKSKISKYTNTIVTFDIYYGKGVDQIGEILDLAEGMDLIEKSGSWYSYDGVKIGQGRENVKQFLKDNEEVYLELKEKIVGIE